MKRNREKHNKRESEDESAAYNYTKISVWCINVFLFLNKIDHENRPWIRTGELLHCVHNYSVSWFHLYCGEYMYCGNHSRQTSMILKKTEIHICGYIIIYPYLLCALTMALQP